MENEASLYRNQSATWEKLFSRSRLLDLIQSQKLFVAKEYDVFISHAVEDKIEVTTELNDLLEKKGLKTWYAGNEFKVGDSISGSILKGLSKCNFGIVVLSHNFFNKDWPRHELSVLRASKMQVFPVWHKMSMKEVEKYDIELADIWGLSTEKGLDQITDELVDKIKQTTVERLLENKKKQKWTWIKLALLGLLLLGTASYFTYRFLEPKHGSIPSGCLDKTKRMGAICKDGTTTKATGSGACSHHGGVKKWLCE